MRLSVHIYLDVQPLRAELAGELAGEALDEAVDRWRRQTIEATTTAVQEMVNVGHRLPDGSPLRLAVDFVDTPADAHHMVVLHASGRIDAQRWLINHPGSAYLHEVLHLLGAWDEYRERFARGGRVVYDDGGIMGGVFAARLGLPHIDQDRPYPESGPRAEVRLMPRDLRRLAAGLLRAIDGPGDGSVKWSVPAPVVVFAEGVLQNTLYGPHRRHRPEDAGRAVAEVRDNGVYRVEGPAADQGWMYPVEWTADEVRYHVEQAFLDAGREGRLVEGAGRRSRQRWTGMYNGVRTEGEVFAGEIVWFRPSADQEHIDPVRYPRLHPVLRLPVEERPARTSPLLSHRTLDVLTYGDRASRSGVYHRLPEGRTRSGGADIAAARSGPRQWHLPGRGCVPGSAGAAG